ncbi:MAG: PAS domain S-box protein [Betaproteobacteria bacterium]
MSGSVDPAVFGEIVLQSTDAIIFSDLDGVIRIWNRGAELIFGHSAAEALGQSLDLIIPAHLRVAHWQGFRRAVDSGHTKYAGKVMTTRAVHKDGSTLYVDLSFGLVADGAGGLAGVVATGRDCTERNLAEKALRSKLRNLEMQPAGPAPDKKD